MPEGTTQPIAAAPVQPTLPNVQPSARASDAERRLAEIEARDAAKREADEQAARDAARANLDTAKKAADEAEKREKEALAKIAAYEGKERKRIAEKLGSLDEETRKRLETLGAKLSVDDYAELVDTTIAARGGDVGRAPNINPASPNGSRRDTGTDGKRALNERAAEILDQLGVNTEAARTFTKVELAPEGGNSRIVFPAQRLIQKLKERAIQPRRLSMENLRKLRGEV